MTSKAKVTDAIARLTSDRAMGQMFIMGFDGTEVTPQIQSLIENHHLGTILLVAKNLKCPLPFLVPASYQN